mgnify:CR=1 FL=1
MPLVRDEEIIVRDEFTQSAVIAKDEAELLQSKNISSKPTPADTDTTAKLNTQVSVTLLLDESISGLQLQSSLYSLSCLLKNMKLSRCAHLSFYQIIGANKWSNMVHFISQCILCTY